jgi:hypothetical protein
MTDPMQYAEGDPRHHTLKLKTNAQRHGSAFELKRGEAWNAASSILHGWVLQL